MTPPIVAPKWQAVLPGKPTRADAVTFCNRHKLRGKLRLVEGAWRVER